jgi:hypothetical protein
MANKHLITNNILNYKTLTPKEFVELLIKKNNIGILEAIAQASELLGVSQSTLTHWYYERKDSVAPVYYWCAKVAEEIQLV